MEEIKYKELIGEIAKKVEPKDFISFLLNLKIMFWGERRALLQDNILDRYDYEEYWDESSIKE